MQLLARFQSIIRARKGTMILGLVLAVVLSVGLFVPQTAEALGLVGGIVAQLASWLISFIVWVIGLLISTVIEILIALATYNEFINAPAVTIGWLVLRDIANMIVVVLLLVIAISTIFSVEEYQYKHMLPRLLIMAVMVNFSKTIVGFLIDASQIVMLTFVAAFREAGAGNFVAALNLEKMLSISPDYTGDAGLLEVLGGLLLALILMTVALITLVVMTVTIGFRIVMLWILTVFSPLVFVLSAVEAGHEYYAKWWKQLTNYLIVGPVLAFFIWLTLASTGGTPGSDSRAVQTFSRGSNGVSYFASAREQQFITTAGHWQNLVGFLIAISMLMGGLMITEELGAAGAGFARSALEGLKDTGKELMHHGLHGAKEIGAWAARKVKAGKLPGGLLKGIELNPAQLYHNIKEQLEEKKHREENEGYIAAIGRLEKGGLSGMMLGLGSKTWLESYGEGFLMRKGIYKAIAPYWKGRTEDHVKKQKEAEEAQKKHKERIDTATAKLATINKLSADIAETRGMIQDLNLMMLDPALDPAKIPELQARRDLALQKAIALEDQLAPLAPDKPELISELADATRRFNASKQLAKEAKRRAEAAAELTPMDFEGRKMRRAEVNDRMKKYDTSNEEELVPLIKAAVERGDTFEAAAIAKKAFSVGHGNEMIQAFKLEAGDLEKYGKNDFGEDRLHPNGKKYEVGDYLSCDADGLAIMMNKIFRDKLKMGAQEAYALQSDLSTEAEHLDSRWYNIAQTIGALPDGTLRQRTKDEQKLHMGVEQDKGDLEGTNRRMGRGGMGGEMYANPKDPSSGRLVFLDERQLRFFTDNFAAIAARGMEGGRFNLSAAMSIVANPANIKVLEQVGEMLKKEGRFEQRYGKKADEKRDWNDFMNAIKQVGQGAMKAGKEMQGTANLMQKTMREIGAVRAQTLGYKL